MSFYHFLPFCGINTKSPLNFLKYRSSHIQPKSFHWLFLLEKYTFLNIAFYLFLPLSTAYSLAMDHSTLALTISWLIAPQCSPNNHVHPSPSSSSATYIKEFSHQLSPNTPSRWHSSLSEVWDDYTVLFRVLEPPGAVPRASESKRGGWAGEALSPHLLWVRAALLRLIQELYFM